MKIDKYLRSEVGGLKSDANVPFGLQTSDLRHRSSVLNLPSHLSKQSIEYFFNLSNGSDLNF
ncbi:MAG TPA: hypothetical protein PLT16_10455, partial [Daejeonella sp.]|nr:hypothetical protein [Daejeonella sp.]